MTEVHRNRHQTTPEDMPRLKPSPLPKVVAVPEIDADESLRRVYADTKSVLQVPWMGVVTMAFAQYPAFYGTLWGGLRDLAASEEFVAACARLRESAEAEVAGFGMASIVPALQDMGYITPELQRIRDEIEVFSHGNMPYLLIATAGRLLLEGHGLGPVSPVAACAVAHGPRRLDALVLMERHHVEEPLRRVYDNIMETLGLPFVNTDYRALARWPSYFSRAWNDLRARLETTAYEDACARVHHTAIQCVKDLPNPGGLSPEILRAAAAKDGNSQPIDDVVRLFQWLLPGLIVNVEAFRQQLNG